MDTTIKKQLPKALLYLSIAAFIGGCSSQSISLPGSQLLGQKADEDKTDTKTKTAAKREPFRLKAEPATGLAKKTEITAIKTPGNTTQTTGVTASEAKLPARTPVQTVIAQPTVKPSAIPAAPRVTTAPKVTTVPKPVVKPVSTETTRRLTLSGSTNFKTGSSTLNQAGKDKLASLARTLSAQGTKISRLLVEGYTDSVGAADFNQVLSLKRANAVADYLASQGLVRSSMETVGHGENSPVADNKTKEGRALNRRVEITATGTRLMTR